MTEPCGHDWHSGEGAQRIGWVEVGEGMEADSEGVFCPDPAAPPPAPTDARTNDPRASGEGAPRLPASTRARPPLAAGTPACTCGHDGETHPFYGLCYLGDCGCQGWSPAPTDDVAALVARLRYPRTDSDHNAAALHAADALDRLAADLAAARADHATTEYALNELLAATGGLAALAAERGERDALRRQVAAVRALHVDTWEEDMGGNRIGTGCAECDQSWPCPTVAALDIEEPS